MTRSLILGQIGDPLDEVFEGSAKPVKSPHNEGIPSPDVVEGVGEAFSFRFGAADDVSVDFQAASRTQRVLLKMKVLLVG